MLSEGFDSRRCKGTAQFSTMARNSGYDRRCHCRLIKMIHRFVRPSPAKGAGTNQTIVVGAWVVIMHWELFGWVGGNLRHFTSDQEAAVSMMKSRLYRILYTYVISGTYDLLIRAFLVIPE